MTKLSSILALIMGKKESIVTTGEIISQGYRGVDVSRILTMLSKDNVIYKISRGIYSKHPPESVDVFYLSQRIFPGYLGMASACYLYGWLEYFPFEIYNVTKNKSSSRKVGKFFIRAVALKEKAVGSQLFGKYVISSKGKTLFDIFYRPDMVGGWEEAMKIIYKSDADRQDWEEFLGFSSRFGSSSFRQRAGYTISCLKERTNKKIPIALGRLKPKTMVVARLGSGKTVSFSDDWQIVDCLGEDIFRWYDGY